MILIKNTQRKIKINEKRIEQDVLKMLRLLHYQDFDIGLWFTTNHTIRQYNKRFRNKDKPTDILSFPNHPNLKPGQKIMIVSAEDKNLGDMIISLEFVKKSAAQLHIPFSHHLQTLLAHGIAHLLGYTHDSKKEHERMRKMERWLLGALLKK